jgi:hypothetical protein
MPPPTIVGTATTDVAAAGGYAPAFPSGIASGDILLWMGESVGGQNFTAPGAPWAALDTISPVVETGNNTQLTCFWRRYDGTGSAPSLTGPADHGVSAMIAVRGCPASGNPWNVLAPAVSTTSTTAVNCPTVTTTLADTLVLLMVATSADIASAQISSMTNANLTSITERVDVATQTGGGGVLICYSGIKATAGATGITTGTVTTAGFKAYITVAMAPTVAVDVKSKRRMTRGAAQRASRW